MTRSHLYYPVVDASGDLFKFVTATFYDPATGLPLTTPLYGSLGSTVALPNPATFVPGVIELWSEQPIRLDIVASGPASNITLQGLDLLPPPEQSIRMPNSVQILGTPDAGKIIKVGSDGIPRWSELVLLPDHEHTGGNTGVTTVNGIPPTTADDGSIDETWVGYDSGTTSTTAAHTSLLGSHARATGQAVTIAGAYTVGAADDTAHLADRGTALGAESKVIYEGVVLGEAEDATGHHRGTVWWGVGNTTEPTVETIGIVTCSDAQVDIGASVAKPATPGGVTVPFWLRAPVLHQGPTFEIVKDARLGASGSSIVGFHESAGAAKPSSMGSTGNAALTSLLAALSAIGLIP